MTPKLKKIIIAILVLIVLFVVYAIFIKADPKNPPLIAGTSTVQGSEEAKVLGSQISQALLRIEQIKLDKSIFESKIFQTLKDRSVPIEDEPMGRSNPFAPLGDISVNSTTRSASSTATSTRTTSRTATTTNAGGN
jgi:hypothetical protein